MTFANPTVLEFYKKLPFNYQTSVAEQVRAIRGRNSVEAYPVLAKLLGAGTRVLEVGCGTGWLSNGIACYYKSSVLGIDFNPVAVERARAVAEGLGLPTQFREADLFLFEPPQPFDVVVSIGVLHHTDNCHAALDRLFSTFVKPGGHAFIGLYHEFGRRPFLDHFAAMKAAGASEDEMFQRFRRMTSSLTDDVQALSWFRDQVLHPHETQHSLAEMLDILDANGMDLIATSINDFGPIGERAELLVRERQFRDLGLHRLREDRYFPGFFVFLARKRPS